jgi:hypothetical protein
MAQLLFAPLPPKAAAEKKEYSFVWTKELEKDGDSIAAGDAASVWAVTPAGVTINVTDKVKTHDDQTTTVWLDPSSTPGDYTVTNTITTAQGRVHVATASLRVVA